MVIATLLKEDASVFPPQTTIFEQTIIGIDRRYDAIVDGAVTIGGRPGKRYFEFKSYGSVPPANFAEQFLKDLNNPDIIDLNQLRWLFDAAKNPANFEMNMKTAIDGLDLSVNKIPAATFQELGINGEAGLRVLIEQNFSNIFNLN
ncbi:hypothetical protein [Dyadobacter jiangsuensis]|uniref:hypothetical protein n=1 Tax=Dyadobacter jiangsuensis TaxID=1591085 RepID=UPI000D0D737D|nr:hypothetical protein [Dyadobacter jiangsuensis]